MRLFSASAGASESNSVAGVSPANAKISAIVHNILQLLQARAEDALVQPSEQLWLQRGTGEERRRSGWQTGQL